VCSARENLGDYQHERAAPAALTIIVIQADGATYPRLVIRQWHWLPACSSDMSHSVVRRVVVRWEVRTEALAQVQREDRIPLGIGLGRAVGM
jgi:hypothetical protein